MRYLVALALVLTVGVSGQELMPGTARPLIKDLPSATSGYICPMHPNEVKAEPGTCSICGMTLVPGDPMATADYNLTLTTEPKVFKAGEKVRFRIAVTHPLTGEPVKAFGEVHDRLFHLFIIIGYAFLSGLFPILWTVITLNPELTDSTRPEMRCCQL